jgi:hypothetical protein
MLKVNDRVVVIDSSGDSTSCKKGDKGIVIRDTSSNSATYRVRLDKGGCCDMYEERFELIAGHFHKDLIIQWANGAEIQVRSPGSRWGFTRTPGWDTSLEYQVKPEVTPQQVEIKRIEEEMRKLANALSDLKGEQ